MCVINGIFFGPDASEMIFERGDSVRLCYDKEIGDGVEEFVKSKVSFGEVGVFRGALVQQHEHPLIPWMNVELKKVIKHPCAIWSC